MPRVPGKNENPYILGLAFRLLGCGVLLHCFFGLVFAGDIPESTSCLSREYDYPDEPVIVFVPGFTSAGGPLGGILQAFNDFTDIKDRYFNFQRENIQRDIIYMNDEPGYDRAGRFPGSWC